MTKNVQFFFFVLKTVYELIPIVFKESTITKSNQNLICAQLIIKK